MRSCDRLTLRVCSPTACKLHPISVLFAIDLAGPAMGKVAALESDYSILTSDNPRGEDPTEIIQEIEKGMPGGRHDVIMDRREAIRAALLEAKEGDTVVIAGKGHETYQTIGTTSHPFDDRVVARELLHELVVGRN